MAVLVHTCPHCSAENAAFRLVHELPNPRDGRVSQAWFTCPSCTLTVTALLQKTGLSPLSFFAEDIKKLPNITISKIYPGSGPAKAPGHISERVSDLYLEAMDSLKRQKWTSAASMFRKTLEIALKDVDPTIEAWKLEKRIDKLAQLGKITPAIQDWAHELRLDGNEALHGDTPADEATATAMQALTQHTLNYLFTLPKMVELARAARNVD